MLFFNDFINKIVEVDAERGKKQCPYCNSTEFYHYTFDAYFCANCNQWLEDACGDAECWYCQRRPDRPFSMS